MLKQILALIITSLVVGATTLSAAPPANQPVLVTTAIVKQITWKDQVEALGTLLANESVDITANVTEQVGEIHFNDGDAVSKDQLLVVLEKSEEEADLAAAKAQQIQRKAAYQRVQNLASQKLAAVANLDETLALLRESEANIDAITAQINDRIIRAPFAGVLGLRNLSVGTLVQPGTVIATLDDISQMKVDFSLPETELATIKSGSEISVKIDAYPDREFTGEITQIDSRIDPVTRSFIARAILANPEKILKPGLLAKITIYKNPRQSLILPEECLLSRGEKQFVYVVNNENKKSIAVLTEVNVGATRPGVVEITGGLQVGQTVVSHGIIKLRDGQEIVLQKDQK